MHIQGVSRLVDITAGGDFLDLCDQKSSYKHVSDFGRLRSYGHFLIPVHALVWTALWNQLAGDVLSIYMYINMMYAYITRHTHTHTHQMHTPVLSNELSVLQEI